MNRLDTVPNITGKDLPNDSLGKIPDVFLGKGKKHPAEQLAENKLRQEQESKILRSEFAYGLHASLKMRTEYNLLASSRRLPGLSSSFLGLEVLTGYNDTIAMDECTFKESEIDPVGNLSFHQYIEEQLQL